MFMFRRRPPATTPLPVSVPAPPPREPPAWNYPEIAPAHVADDARLFATRDQMLLGLGLPARPVVAEVGVGLGTLSAFMLERLAPRQYVAIDLFRLHEEASLWGRPSAVALDGLTHRAFYERRTAGHADVVAVCEGASDVALAAWPDFHFDMVYVDADHTYAAVARDARVAAAKVAADGVLVFNDYLLFDHHGAPYGVVPAVNELIAAGGWQVVGFCFAQLMYCDIALRRAGSGG